MTIQNYSISGLKDLLNDLENLSTSLIALQSSSEHVDSGVLSSLQESQFSLIQTVNGYATILQALNSGDLPD